MIWLDLLQEKVGLHQEIWQGLHQVTQWDLHQKVIWDHRQEIWQDHHQVIQWDLHQKVIWDHRQEIWQDHHQVIQWDRLRVIWDHRQVIQWDRLQVIWDHRQVIWLVNQDQWTADRVVLIHYLVKQDQQVDHLQEICLQVIRWVNQDQWMADQVIRWDLHRMIWVVCILIWMMQQLMDLKIQDQEHQIQWPVIWMVMV